MGRHDRIVMAVLIMIVALMSGGLVPATTAAAGELGFDYDGVSAGRGTAARLAPAVQESITQPLVKGDRYATDPAARLRLTPDFVAPNTAGRRNSAGQAIGSDGRFVVDPARPGSSTVSRPYIRQGVRDEALARAPRDAQGRLLDPNTFEVIDGPYHLGHRPGHEWWRIRDRAAAEGWTPQQLSDYVNNPDLYQIELPANNLSHRYEMPR